jgi:hypothetical protein
LVFEVWEVKRAVILNEVKDLSIARVVTLATLRNVSRNCEVPRYARDDTRKSIHNGAVNSCTN